MSLQGIYSRAHEVNPGLSSSSGPPVVEAGRGRSFSGSVSNHANLYRLAIGFALVAAGFVAGHLRNPYKQDVKLHEAVETELDMGAVVRSGQRADFASNLPNGIHVVRTTTPHAGAQYFLVIKDVSVGQSLDAGYFGMTEIAAGNVPQTSPDQGNQAFKFWTLSEGHTVSAMQDGIHNIEIPADILPGHQSLNVTVIKDHHVNMVSGDSYGFLGVSAAPQVQAP